ncbi:hypothetical protein SCP_0411530 [Sparassis crispa]|uniref:Uncharacterized protein n=1 Tax=Sparassis crispa TaxID=139825 RepID=A0A401GKS0_9APHY|nr:hypothetical protein SCP_0411530 [Sparassis crispa]GBE82768.1 hypothetical protein SCP_0411530 [Sparassis crispa]
MQLASSGTRALIGCQTFRFTPTGGGLARIARSIHIPSTPAQTRTTAQTLFRHARTLLSRFATHLTTPGIGSTAHAARTLYSGPAHTRTIQQGLSLPVRYALAHPFRAPHLPRAPAVPRNTTQVGLGLARNFSTARPVFQSLADNVPVSGRAFWEADWDMKMHDEREKLRMKKYKKAQEKKARKARKEMRQTRVVPAEKPVEQVAAAEEDKSKDDLEHYFPAPTTPDVTTHLLIPLAPTPTARMPLSPSPYPSTTSAHPLLPLPIIAGLHNSHNTHALRVSSLFARLDAAKVFTSSDVCCTARGDPRGLCTLLEVRFVGWDAARVRGVLGEAGSGWCVLEEVRSGEEHAESASMDAILEEMSVGSESDAGAEAEVENSAQPEVWHQSVGGIDPAHSFVLPTLDFSASFPVASDTWSASPPLPDVLSLSSGLSSPLADLEFHNAWSSATLGRTPLPPSSSAINSGIPFETLHGDFSDTNSDTSWIDPQLSPAGSDSQSWCGVGFSSNFSDKIQSEAEVF